MSATAEQVKAFCPNCGDRTAVQHCPTRKCGWMRCMNSECLAVIDPSKGIGFRPRRKDEEPKTAPKIGAVSHLPWKAAKA